MSGITIKAEKKIGLGVEKKLKSVFFLMFSGPTYPTYILHTCHDLPTSKLIFLCKIKVVFCKLS